MKKIILAILTFAICNLQSAIYSSSFAADCTWIETSGEAAVENMTSEEARQSALNKARTKAVEGVSGINVQGSTLVKDFALVADFIHTLTSGHVVEEKVLGWDSKSFQDKPDAPPVTVYKVNLRTCVKAADAGDPYFKVKAELNRPVFMAGDEARITAGCTRDCYLTIVNISADNNISILYPNKIEPAGRMKGGASYTFPSVPGLALEMYPLQGHKRDTEAFYIIATKGNFDLQGMVKKTEGLTSKELYNSLLSLPATERAEEIVLYEVRAKE